MESSGSGAVCGSAVSEAARAREVAEVGSTRRMSDEDAQRLLVLVYRHLLEEPIRPTIRTGGGPTGSPPTISRKGDRLRGLFLENLRWLSLITF